MENPHNLLTLRTVQIEMIIFKARALKWNQHAIQLSYIDCGPRKVCCNYTTITRPDRPRQPASARRAFVSEKLSTGRYRSYHFTSKKMSHAPASHTARLTDNRTSKRSAIYEHIVRVYVCICVFVYVHIRQRESRDKCCARGAVSVSPHIRHASKDVYPQSWVAV